MNKYSVTVAFISILLTEFHRTNYLVISILLRHVVIRIILKNHIILTQQTILIFKPSCLPAGNVFLFLNFHRLQCICVVQGVGTKSISVPNTMAQWWRITISRSTNLSLNEGRAWKSWIRVTHQLT